MKIVTLVENTTRDSLLCEHGLSFYITFNNKNYLLDAGSTSMFMDNAEVLGIDVHNVECAVLSHAHYDHSGGFMRYLDENKKVSVYAMEKVDTPCYSTSGGTLHYIGVDEQIIQKHRNRFIEIKDPTYIDTHVLLLPHTLVSKGNKNLFVKEQDELILDDFSHELSLIFESEKGLVVFNSCSHVGIKNIIEEVKMAIPNQPIYAFIGGLHMKGKKDGKEISIYQEEEIEALCKYLKDVGLKHLYTGHCTGSVAYRYFEKYAKEIVDELYSGKVISF